MSSKARSSAASNRKDPPPKRKKKPSPATTTEPTSITSLPDDLLLNCLARVSRLYYLALSRVSKKFRSIVASPEIYNTRSLLNRTEKCLYLCLRFPFDNNTHWFTLYQNPNRTVSNKSSGNVFVQIPSPQHYPLTKSSSPVAVGSNIYKIGGTVGSDFSIFGGDRYPSSEVSVLDCRFHKWHHAPSMRLDRGSSTASLVDGKIYVAGGSKDNNSSNWVEVFDPKTQTWSSVTNPSIEIHNRRVLKSLGFEGKFYLFGDKYVVYNPEEGIWDPIAWDSHIRCAVGLSCCVIDNVLFFWEKGVFKWYDCKVSSWKELKGVEGLPDHLGDREYCKLVDLGGKMAVLWDVCGCSEVNMICCAEIALERRDGDEIWGKVEWSDSMFAVEANCTLFDADALSASV